MKRFGLCLVAIVLATLVPGASARNNVDKLDPLWYGTWESDDGKSTMTISATKIDFVYLQDIPGEEPQQENYRYDWSNEGAAEASDPYMFWYSGERISEAELRDKLEKAIAKQQRDTAGVFQVKEPATARRVINALTPGVYGKIWTAGDIASEYIIDGDWIVEIEDDECCNFAIQRFKRVVGLAEAEAPPQAAVAQVAAATSTERTAGRGEAKENPPGEEQVPQGDRIKVKDGSTLSGTIKGGKLPFKSSFGELEVSLDNVRSFADGKLSLADGTVLKGAFGDGEVEIVTNVGTLEVDASEIAGIERGGITKPEIASGTGNLSRERAATMIEENFIQRDRLPEYTVSVTNWLVRGNTKSPEKCFTKRAQVRLSRWETDPVWANIRLCLR